MKKIIVILFVVFFFTGGRAMAQTINSDSVFTGFPAMGKAINNDSLIQQYCKAHKLSPVKSASGLYYVIKKAGNGPAVTDGQKVSVNYTGSLTDGFIFDSNMKKKYHHKTPFEYVAGAGQLIANDFDKS